MATIRIETNRIDLAKGKITKLSEVNFKCTEEQARLLKDIFVGQNLKHTQHAFNVSTEIAIKDDNGLIIGGIKNI